MQRNPLDFQSYLQGDNPIELETFALWIRHLEKRIAISQRYLETISRKSCDKATRCSTSAIVSNDRDHGIELQLDTISLLEEGEIREDPLQISQGPSELEYSEVLYCLSYFEQMNSETTLQLLQRVEEFHASHTVHKAMLTDLMAEAQRTLENTKTCPNVLVGDAQVLKAQVLAEACYILAAEVKGTAITEAFCGEVLLQTALFRIEAYEKAWEVIQPIIDIIESITQLHQS